MKPDLVRLRTMAEERLDENFEFRHFLKRETHLTSQEVDQVVAEISARVWKKTDCTTCGNCCRVASPDLSQNDLDRLVSHLGTTHAAFTSKHLKPCENPEDGSWSMRERPCPFLKDNKCSVYEARPDNCRDYPYVDRPHFTSRSLAMIDRIAECPAVFEIWEELKLATNFRGRRR